MPEAQTEWEQAGFVPVPQDEWTHAGFARVQDEQQAAPSQAFIDRAHAGAAVLNALPDKDHSSIGDTLRSLHDAISFAPEFWAGANASYEAGKQNLYEGRQDVLANRPASGVAKIGWGALQAVQAPIAGLLAPVEQTATKVTGDPVFGEKAALLAGLALGRPDPIIRAPGGNVARIVTTPEGKVDAQIIGPLPTDPDFAAAARQIVGRAQANTKLALPVDMRAVALASEHAGLTARATEIDKALSELPQGSPEAAEKLSRLQAIEGDLAKASTAEERRALSGRRDQLLADTNPDELRAQAAPLEQRRQLEAERASLTARQGEIEAERAAAPKPAMLGQAEPARIDPVRVQENLKRLWEEQGIHPAEAAHDAESDAFLAHDLGAAAAHPTDMPPLVSPDVQPTTIAGKIAADLRGARDAALDIKHWVQKAIAPISAGPDYAIDYTTKYLSGLRRVGWDAARYDQWLSEKLTLEQQQAVWRAMDEESVMRQTGETSEHMGLATLAPEERAVADELSQRAQALRLQQIDRGMVEGEGLPVYAPRVFAGIERGENVSLGSAAHLRERTGSMLQRKYLTAEESEAAAKAKYGEGVQLVRNVRVIPRALAQQEKAIIAHDFIEGIREYGLKTGDPQVIAADAPLPPGEEAKWFTIADSDLTRTVYRQGEDGTTYATKVPLRIKAEWAGPIQAINDVRVNNWDKFIINVKNRPMSLIMNSPFLHDTVVFSKALPAHPGLVLTYRFWKQGGNLLNDAAFMHEMLDAGLVPWGRRPMLGQDVTSIAEGAQIQPGRSWTSQVLSYVPGLFSETAATAIKRAVDKAGELVHDKLLGEPITRLQTAIAYDRQQELLGKFPDADRTAINILAAHDGNRFAGSLPPEAMSAFSRGVSNALLFSRQWTLGNIGIAKDALNGLPEYVRARVEQTLGPENKELATAMQNDTRRHMAAAIALDFVMFYGINAMLQSAVHVASGTPMSDEAAGYWWRLKQAANRIEEHPLSPTSYLSFLPSLSPTFYHEPGKEGKLLLGLREDGTAIYGRSVIGRMGEDYLGIWNLPQFLMQKAAPIPRALVELLRNQDSFDRKIYDDTPWANGTVLWSLGQVAKHLIEAELPMQQINSGSNLLNGKGDYKDVIGLLGPYAPPPFTITASQGYPGGPVGGVVQEHKARERFEQGLQLSTIRDMVKAGQVSEARQKMGALGMSPGFQNWMIKTTRRPDLRVSPRALQEFYQHSTPHERELIEYMRGQ